MARRRLLLMTLVVLAGVQAVLDVFSPYEGDVTRGILGGMIIETRVHPYINLSSLRTSQVHIKAFFLKVARHYEP